MSSQDIDLIRLSVSVSRVKILSAEFAAVSAKYFNGQLQKQWWGTGMVICLERGADLDTAQLMPLPLTVSCFSKIQIGFTFLVPAHLGIPGKRAIKRGCVQNQQKFLLKEQ